MQWKLEADKLPDQTFPFDTKVNDAYQITREFERGMMNHEDSEISATGIIQARFLGQLIIQAISDEGRQVVASEVLGCNEDVHLLRRLATTWEDHFI